jgi:hypothetical protein
LFN